MDEQRQDDLLEPIYNTSVPILDVALKTSQERWTIETDWRERVREIRAGRNKFIKLLFINFSKALGVMIVQARN